MTGHDFNHSRTWLLERRNLLSGTFTIDVCAYAITSNHFHLVLYIDHEEALALSDEQVIR